MARRYIILGMAVTILLGAWTAWAQGGDSASIVGQVAIEGGKELPDEIEIQVRLDGSENARSIKVSDNGSFYVPNLEPGPYTVIGSAGELMSGPYSMTLFHGQTVKVEVVLQQPTKSLEDSLVAALLADEREDQVELVTVTYFFMDKDREWQRETQAGDVAQLFRMGQALPLLAVDKDSTERDDDAGS